MPGFGRMYCFRVDDLLFFEAEMDENLDPSAWSAVIWSSHAAGDGR
jgi:hypothetical protein